MKGETMNLDDEVVKRAMKGENEAFNEIIRQYENSLFVFLYKKVGNRELTLDLLQETFTDAFVSLSSLRDANHLASWLFTIARRKAWLAKRHTEYWDELPDTIPIAWSPADEAMRNELSDIVRRAIKKLPERLNEVVQMHYLDETPYPEICEKLGIPITTLKSRLHFARRQLHDELAPFIEDTLIERHTLRGRKKEMELKRPEISFNEVPGAKMDVELSAPPNCIELRESAKGEFVWFRNEADGINQPVYLVVKQQVAGKAMVSGEECWEVEEELIAPDGKFFSTGFHYFDKRKDFTCLLT
jgi:RNA polymerase sigma-70 factor (ECF subfamily)